MTWRRHHTRTLGETAAPSARLHARFHAVGHGHRVRLRADDDEAAQADHRQPDVLSDVTRRDKSEPVPSAGGGLTTVGLDMDVEDVGGGEMWSQGFHRSGREVLKGRECEAPLRRQEAARAWIARRSESASTCMCR